MDPPLITIQPNETSISYPNASSSRTLHLPYDLTSKERSRTASPADASPRNLKTLNKRNFRGETQLHIAAQKGDLELSRKLVEDGANINSADNAGWTPLHEACAYGYYDLAELLIRSGADVNMTSTDGVCPLHDAVQSSNSKLVWLLLKHGAEKTKKSARGHLPHELNNGNTEIEELLKETKVPQLFPYGLKSEEADKKGIKNPTTPCSSSGSSADGSSDSDSSGSASTSTSRSASPTDKTLTGELDETLKADKTESKKEASTVKEQLLTTAVAEKDVKISPTSVSKLPIGSSAVKAIALTYSPEKHCPSKQTRKRPNVKRGGGASKAQSSAHHSSTTTAACSSSNDVYEFHSSPESNEMPSIAVSLQKTGSNSALAAESGVDGSSKLANTPPPKRIKTATLAKELLAAAAASGSPLSSNFGAVKMEETTVRVDEDQKNVGSPMDMGGDLIIDEEDYGLDSGQAYFSSSNLPLVAADTQAETKKVPPLRILLPKTPSEEDGGSETHSPTLSVTTAAKKQRAPTSKHATGDKEKGKKHHHHHHHHSDRKEDTQRLTRSRVKQTGATLNEVPRWGQKRGRAGKTSVDNADQTEQDGVKLEQEEDEVEGEADGPEDEYSRSDAGEESRSAFERKSKEPEEGSAVNQKPSTTTASATLLLFSKNSFDQTVEFSRMIQDKWAKGFVDELERDVVKPSHLADLDRIEFVHRQTQAEQKLPLIVNFQESWPESLQKLAIEHARRREQMEIAHKAERERLFQFGKRELVRLMQKTAAFSHSNINVVRLLRDAELYNPSTFDSAMDEPPEIQLASRAQLLQRLKHMASTTKKRHTMEAHSLVVCQQAEWDKMSSRISHQNSLSDSYGRTKVQMTHLGVAQVHVEETLFPYMQ